MRSEYSLFSITTTTTWDVDERGTEAGAGTGLAAPGTACPHAPSTSKATVEATKPVRRKTNMAADSARSAVDPLEDRLHETGRLVPPRAAARSARGADPDLQVRTARDP